MLPISVEGSQVNHCNSDTNLGSAFTADGSTSSAVKARDKDEMKHFNKCVSFLYKDNDIPFSAKKSARCHGITYSLIWMRVVAEC